MDEDNATDEQHGTSDSLRTGDAARRRYLVLMARVADGEVSEEDLDELARLERYFPEEQMPERLRSDLLRTAAESCATGAAAADQRGAERIAQPGRPAKRSRFAIGALAAGITAIALAGWWSSEDRAGHEADLISRLSADAGRARLLAASGGAFRWPCATEQGKVVGDVVWDNERQAGYLLLSGVLPNDPARTQYQLWIFDAERDERYPVNAGTFDMPSGSVEIVVPFHAELRVERPLAFAVTEERAGGVVVSSRSNIVAVARAEGN
ncbi:MAG TPA: anti-sigma factor [Steroidobacteraceae bacterium]|nr:anti-sigma factor [Steroidobacteraceae bacterium]